MNKCDTAKLFLALSIICYVFLYYYYFYNMTLKLEGRGSLVNIIFYNFFPEDPGVAKYFISGIFFTFVSVCYFIACLFKDRG